MLTQRGVGIGTPEYMSPEQGHGLPVDGRTDQYALAMTIFEMLTGAVPFHGETPIATILQQINQPVPSVRAAVPSIPSAVDEAIQRALAKRPDDRFPSVLDLAAALRDAAASSSRSDQVTPITIASDSFGADLDAPTVARPPSSPELVEAPTAPRARSLTSPPRRRVPLLTAFGLGTAVLMGAALLFMRSSQSPSQAESAGSTPGAVIIAATPDLVPTATPLPAACQDPAGKIALAESQLASGAVVAGRLAITELADCPNADARLVAGRLEGADRLVAAQASGEAGDWDGALGALRELSAREPLFPGLPSHLFEALMGAGSAALAEGALDTASAYCGEALAIRPADAGASLCVTGAIPPTPTSEPTAPPTATRALEPTARPVAPPTARPTAPPPPVVPQVAPTATLRPPPAALPTATLRPPLP